MNTTARRCCWYNIDEGAYEMGNRLLLTATSLIALGLATSANADGWYVEGFMGGTSPTTISNDDKIELHSDLTPYGGLAGGRRFDDIGGTLGLNLYTEVSTDLRGFEIHGLNPNGTDNSATGDLLIWNTSINGGVGYEVTEKVELVAMAGIGVAMLDADNVESRNLNENLSETTAAFSYTAGLSVVYHVTDEWAALAGYRYTVVPSYSLGDYDGDVSAHSFLLGVRYSF